MAVKRARKTQPELAQESHIPTKPRLTATRKSQKPSCSQAMPQKKRRRKADAMMISIHSDGSTEAPSDAINSDEDDSPVSTPDKRQKVLKVSSQLLDVATKRSALSSTTGNTQPSLFIPFVKENDGLDLNLTLNQERDSEESVYVSDRAQAFYDSQKNKWITTEHGKSSQRQIIASSQPDITAGSHQRRSTGSLGRSTLNRATSLSQQEPIGDRSVIAATISTDDYNTREQDTLFLEHNSVPSAPLRVRSPLLPKLNSRSYYAALQSDDQETDSLDYLWSRAPRRGPCVSTPEHEQVVDVCERYLKAIILSGQAGQQSTPWPELTRSWFSKIMGRAWRKVSKDVGSREGRRDSGVDIKPAPCEARKFYDSFCIWRSRFMEKVRILVQSRYNWHAYSETETQGLVRKLLTEDNFACLDYSTEPPKGRFCADIIADVIAQCVFGSKKSGMALNPYTKDLFNPLPINIIILAVVGIGHSIREYESGQKKVIKFDGIVEEESWLRIASTWHQQSSTRQTAIQEILLNRIRRLTRNTSTQIVNSKPIFDEYANSLDDLPIAELQGCQSQQILKQHPRTEQVTPSAADKTIANSSVTPHLYTTKEIPPHQEKSDNNEDTGNDKLNAQDYLISIVECQNGNQTISEGEVSWDLDWEEFKENLQVENDYNVWYTKTKGGQCIIDDETSYAVFLDWARLQNKNGDEVRVEVVKGWPEPES